MGARSLDSFGASAIRISINSITQRRLDESVLGALVLIEQVKKLSGRKRSEQKLAWPRRRDSDRRKDAPAIVNLSATS